MGPGKGICTGVLKREGGELGAPGAAVIGKRPDVPVFQKDRGKGA